MDKTVSALRQLFLRLQSKQDTVWSREDPGIKPSARARAVWNRLIHTRWAPITEIDIERWFPASSNELHVDSSCRGSVLYLPPLEKDAEFVPVLDVKCDLDATGAEMKLRVMLTRYLENCGEDGGGKLCGIGFRLESPYCDEEEDAEGDEEKREGRHDFYHAQLIRDFGWGPYIDCPDWLPCTQPSFPLTANCPVTLVLCMLLTLYGKRRCWEFVSEDTGLFSFLNQYLRKLQPWTQWRALT